MEATCVTHVGVCVRDMEESLNSEPAEGLIIVDSFIDHQRWCLSVRSRFLTLETEQKIMANLDANIHTFISSPV